jgi:hypothetical protein
VIFNEYIFTKLLSSVTINSQTTIMEAEFDDPRRKELLQALNNALPAYTVRPTAWACLWLSDIDMLEDIVAQAQERAFPTKATLEVVESLARLVPTCRLLASFYSVRFTNIV